MKRKINFTIHAADDGCSVDTFIRQCGFSKSVRTALKKTKEGILKNGVWCYTSDTLHTGDLLTLTIEETIGSDNIHAVKLPFEMLYEDEDLLVINKPAGMPTHPSLHNYENTLANALAYYFQQKGEAFTFRCVNRLDRQTTGITLVAKNMFASCLLYDAAKKHQIGRTYFAICQGELTHSGIINANIAREADSAITRCVSFTDGAAAVTHYEPVCIKNGHTLVQLTLETGRTHQIRVHMKHIGYPLIGDYLYHPDFSKIQRVALHSAEITFTHPITKECLHLSAPLPADMSALF